MADLCARPGVGHGDLCPRGVQDSGWGAGSRRRVTLTTTVVIQCQVMPDEIVLLYVQKDKGRRRATPGELAAQRRMVAEHQGSLVH